MKLAIFGGSFDPVHIGHVKIVDTVLNSLHVDKVLIIPTYLNPFKSSSFAPANLRLEWLKKLFTCRDRVEILEYEIEQQKATPTIETILYVKKLYKEIDKIYLIIGADNLATLHKWQNFDKLASLVEFVVATRDGIKIPKHLQKMSINANISSSNLRNNIDKSFIPSLIADEVKKYYTRKKMENRIEAIVTVLDSKKAENIQIFDMTNQDYFVDQVVMASTLGERHGIALLDDLKKGLKDESFLHIDDDNEWIVIDLGDILIHLMTPNYRSRYNIEEFLLEHDEQMKKVRQMALEER